MTHAVCIHCGEMRIGALTPCQSCGYRPETAWEIGVSIAHSDHCMTPERISEYSSVLKERFSQKEPFYQKFDHEQEAVIRSFFDKPDGRDIFTLQQTAKYGFLKKQMNWHFIGPDGYEAKVIQRGRDVPKNDFDKHRKRVGSDAFFISAYQDGKKRDAQVAKPIWYAAKDHMRLIERMASHEDHFMRLLTLRSRQYTADYLAENGFPIE